MFQPQSDHLQKNQPPIGNNTLQDEKYVTQKYDEKQLNKEEEKEENVQKQNSDKDHAMKTAGNNKEKKIWLFVAGEKEHVTEGMIQGYTAKKLDEGTSNIEIKSIPTYFKKENKKCFLVGVPTTYKEVYNEQFWPRGIRYTRFDFRKGKHFLDVIKTNKI
ncbi:hypothetical protein TcasGA2_TC014834 [Tribolium castaneum]|uniref:Uncharacterized protein n=1 Tax=Tribolium castaneum TaxID=7070 RepID=D2A4F2_TRICA|nr:hypothetical protein TcasGA2_TC014834 [Tribolium castaneum]